jgi:hypothetical protein
MHYTVVLLAELAHFAVFRWREIQTKLMSSTARVVGFYVTCRQAQGSLNRGHTVPFFLLQRSRSFHCALHLAWLQEM